MTNDELNQQIAEERGHKILLCSRIVDGKRYYWAELDNEISATSDISKNKALALAIIEGGA